MLAAPGARAEGGTSDLEFNAPYPQQMNVGEERFVGMEVFNAGPDEASGVVARLTIPEGLEITETSCPIEGRTLICSLGSIPAGAGASFGDAARVRGTTAGAYTLEGSVSGDQTDPDASNNSDSSTYTVSEQSAELAVSMSAPDAVWDGDTFDYVVRYSNSGPFDATNTIITSTLPSDTSYVSASTGCSADGNVVSCALGTVAKNTGGSVTITAVPTAPGDRWLEASIDSDLADRNAGNNSTRHLLRVRANSDLAISTTAPTRAHARRTLTYEITVSNLGASDADEVRIGATWWWSKGTSAITVLSTSPSQGTCEMEPEGSVGFSCQLGPVAEGAEAVIVVEVRTQGSGTLESSASISGGLYDPDTSNNHSSSTVTVRGPK